MTFLEMILLIEEREEKIASDRASNIQTDKHLYTRLHGDLGWEERELSVTEPHISLASPDPPTEKKKK